MEAHAFAVAKGKGFSLVRPGAGTWTALRHPSGAELCTAEVVVTEDSYRDNPSAMYGYLDDYCALCVSVVTVWKRDEGSGVSSTAVAWFTTDGTRRFAPTGFREAGDPDGPGAVARRNAQAAFDDDWKRLRNKSG